MSGGKRLHQRSAAGAIVTVLALSAMVLSMTGCPLLLPPDQRGPKRNAGWTKGFGYASVGLTGYADFFGEINGIAPGAGATLNIPLAPGPILVAGALVLVVAAAADGSFDLDFSGGGGGGGGPSYEPTYSEYDPFWHGGFANPEGEIFSDLAFDLTFAASSHNDMTHGGMLNYASAMIGARLGGSRSYAPRFYLTGGWGIYVLNYESRPNATVNGPYMGGGLEFLIDNVALAIDYKGQFYFGNDVAGMPVDGGARLVSFLYSFYW